ncbi:MAG: FAD synthase [Metamycoplasmataceae bacterium]
MTIYKYSETKKIKELSDGSIILLGAFELFHKGHKTLLDKAIEVKNEKQKIGLITFSNVEEVFRSNKKKVTSLNYMLDCFFLLKIDFIILIDFNQIKNKEAKDFLDNIKNIYNANLFICGQDYKLGKNAQWNSQDVANNYKTLILELDLFDNVKISSTRIKELISYGEIDLANKLLVWNFGDYFEVIFNKITFDKKNIIPHAGIYNIKIEIDDFVYHGILHINWNNNGYIKLINYPNDLAAGNYKIIFCSLNRIIASSILDKIIEADLEKGITYFYNLQKL